MSAMNICSWSRTHHFASSESHVLHSWVWHCKSQQFPLVFRWETVSLAPSIFILGKWHRERIETTKLLTVKAWFWTIPSLSLDCRCSIIHDSKSKSQAESVIHDSKSKASAWKRNGLFNDETTNFPRPAIALSAIFTSSIFSVCDFQWNTLWSACLGNTVTHALPGLFANA